MKRFKKGNEFLYDKFAICIKSQEEIHQLSDFCKKYNISFYFYSNFNVPIYLRFVDKDYVGFQIRTFTLYRDLLNMNFIIFENIEDLINLDTDKANCYENKIDINSVKYSLDEIVNYKNFAIVLENEKERDILYENLKKYLRFANLERIEHLVDCNPQSYPIYFRFCSNKFEGWGQLKNLEKFVNSDSFVCNFKDIKNIQPIKENFIFEKFVVCIKNKKESIKKDVRINLNKNKKKIKLTQI